MIIKDRQFVSSVLDFYRKSGRHTLPWRQTENPYNILVSEIMLQQTQVARVVPKYEAFITTFPTIRTLARASLKEVLTAWQGLGYNRRAKYLWQTAHTVEDILKGKFPTTYQELIVLPGIGHYTAGAILAFAYNYGIPVVETNIRTAVVHHYFAKNDTVRDQDILKVVRRTLPHKGVREWYYALMDYGVHLKLTAESYNHKSTTYKKQSTFKGSTRQVRAAIIKVLLTAPSGLSAAELDKVLVDSPKKVIETQIQALLKEEMIIVSNKKYFVTT